MENEKKNKHMKMEDRIEIQECLSKGMSFKAIAKRLGKDATTVSREGIPLNKESFYQMDAVLSNAVRSGQSIYHTIHANSLTISQSSIRLGRPHSIYLF